MRPGLETTKKLVVRFGPSAKSIRGTDIRANRRFFMVFEVFSIKQDTKVFIWIGRLSL